MFKNNSTTRRLVAVGAWMVWLSACADDDAKTPIFEAPDIPARAIAASFDVAIDGDHKALSDAWRAPRPEPVMVTGQSQDLALHARVKTTLHRPDVLWVELFVENLGTDGLADVVATITASDGPIYALQNAPFDDKAAAAEHRLGGIAGEGVGRLLIGVKKGPKPTAKQVLKVTIRGATTARQPTASAPLAIEPGGAEVWVAVPDADVVAILDAATDKRIAQVPVTGRPTSVAASTDGRFMWVTASAANKAHVIDRSARKIMRSFGESDGVGRNPRHVVVTPDGGRAAVSSYVSDRLTVFVRRGDSWEVDRHVQVGRRPVGMTATRDGKRVLVAHFLPRGRVLDNEGWISIVDLAAGRVVREAVLDDLLNLDRAGCLAATFGVSPIRMTSEGVPNQVAGVFLTPGGDRAWVPHATLAGFPILERGPKSIQLSAAFDVRPGEAVPGFLSILDTRDDANVRAMPNPGVLERPVSRDYMACSGVHLGIETSENEPIPGQPHHVAARFPAMPSGYTGLESAGLSRFVGFSRGGRRALALSYISDVLQVFDTATMHATSRAGLLLPGSNPTGLVVAPNGRKAWVAYENTLAVSVLDLEALAEPSKLPVATFVPYVYKAVKALPGGTNGLSSKRLVRDLSALPEHPAIKPTAMVALVDKDPLTPAMRRGKVLFTSANVEKHPTLSAATMTSCASCHPDGGNDGSMWATMEGERRTMSLRGGVRGRGWLHASGTHADIHEFVDVVVTERLGGKLAKADIDALAGYVADGIPRLQSPDVDPALAAKGKKVFASKCAGCHSGPQHDSGRADMSHPWAAGKKTGPTLFDVGTATKNAYVNMPTFFESLFPEQEAEILRLTRGDRDLGPGDKLQVMLDFRPRPHRKRGHLKAPSLTGVWDNVLFMHDGRHASLHGVIDHLDSKLGLGMSADDKAAVVAFVKTL